MARLVRDRYYEHTADHAWDLATGTAVRLPELAETVPRSGPALAAFVELLDHGREGAPRWVVLDVETRRTPSAAIDAAAEHARTRGFVPIAVDLYARLHDLLIEELRDRALVLIARPAVPVESARAAFIDACARSPRPHVLVTFRSAEPPRSKRRELPFIVHEARAVYGAQPVHRATPAAWPPDVVQHIVRGARAADFVREGRHAAAERLLRDVGAALLRRRAFAPACDSALALGRLLLERGRARAADEIFGEAATHAGAAGDESLAVAARLWQAAARTDAGRLAAAESVCRGMTVAGGLDEIQRAWAEATLARILLWQGRADDAASLAFVTPSCPPGSGAWVHATAVRVLVERDQLFDAGQRSRALLTSTSDGGDHAAMLIALTAHLRVLLSTGDLVLAEDCLTRIGNAARVVRSPLRMARARLLYADALARAGRARDRLRQLTRLRRLLPVAPPLLRDEIERRLRGEASRVPVHRSPAVAPSTALALVTLVHREEHDRDALAHVCESVAASLQASRVDLWSCDAGPATVVLSTGTGMTTRLGARVLEAGIPIGPEADDPAHEVAVPVRLGSKLLAALAARWPVDRTAPGEANELLSLAAALAAPRLESLLAAARERASAATAIPELVGTDPSVAGALTADSPVFSISVS